MFDPNAITTQQSTQIQYQEQKPAENKQDGQQQKTEFPSFCYANVNMIHKLTPNTQALNSTVNMAQLTDDKCYITQPFSYNYALVNQMQLAQNIQFKCDICGMMFNNLSLLNHHKRIHNTTNDQNTQHITVSVFILSVCIILKLFTVAGGYKSASSTPSSSNSNCVC